VLALIGTIACSLALLPSGARWLRVAQREHYLAGSTLRSAARWWGGSPLAMVMGAAALGSAFAAFDYPVLALVTAAAVVLGPPALSPRGRTSPLAFTRRLRLLALSWLFLQALIVALGVVTGRPAALAALGACGVPVLLSCTCAALSPVERRLVTPFITSAKARLSQVDPLVVAITGSYGKTSTKQHVAHLVAGSRTVVASPASFNNRAGLARAINEQLTPGTDVFVAEMGTYGKGEIAELCRWCPPEIAVITAIGPVHLERFKTEEAIVAAKAEITESAHTVILNVDDAHLAAFADRLTVAGGKKVIRCSVGGTSADLRIVANGDRIDVQYNGATLGRGMTVPGTVQLSNLACALAVAQEVGVPPAMALSRVADLPAIPNRLVAAQAESGVWVIDDTFNSNPAGSQVALSVLAALPVIGRRVVVTPGMVELGPRQFSENRAFGEAIARVATDLLIVGHTNRKALLAGGAGLRPLCVATRDDAVAWVRSNLGPGDAVLYENDLPDHYR
jgi:UDP-N-acetylmuramoyl-tripeptide--D-alanyl-D-alanine ligase